MDDAQAYLAFVGTYVEDGDETLYSYRIDASTGELDPLATTDAGPNPSFLAVHPNREYLYAVNSTDEGTVTALSFDRGTGELSRVNRQPSGGAGPCYCSVDATGERVLVAHYSGGSVSVLPLSADGRLGEPTDVVEHEGSSVDPERQTEPHPHSVLPGPENRFAYAPDLGADRVVIYEMDRDADTLAPADPPHVDVHPGAGPRHLDFHPNGRFAYLVNELDSTLTAFERDSRTGALSEVETVSTLPAGFDGENYPADVHVHPSGQWVYASNRGHDSIAAFALDEESGRPEFVGTTSTRGEWPRDFALDPAGRHLFAENQYTDDVATFRVGDAGELDAAGRLTEVPQPTCLKMVPE